jgi:hypothetical protein
VSNPHQISEQKIYANFNTTGITAYLKNGGTLEKAASMATMPAHGPRSYTTAGRTISAWMRLRGLACEPR